MKYLSVVFIIVCLILGLVAEAQNTSSWQLDTVTFVSYSPSHPDRVSADGNYVAESVAGVAFKETLNYASGYQYYSPYRSVLLPMWLDNTMLYSNIEWDGHPSPQCSSQNLTTFELYDADTNTNEFICIDVPQVYYLQRYLYDNYVVFADNQYLINLQTSVVQDVSGTLSTQINIVDAINWVGHDNTWWDVQSQTPVARIQEATSPDLAQTISICPMESENCIQIVNVSDFAYGTLSDVIVSPDGQTILWSVISFLSGSEISLGLPPQNSIDDVIAFATDVQTGTTEEIFSLSDYYTSTAVGREAYWSPDGQTLMINMYTEAGLTSDDGIIIAKLLPPSNLTATLQGTAWLDSNQDGIQGTGEVSNGMPDVTVNLLDGVGGVVQSTTTASDGSYSFVVDPGKGYRLEFIPTGYLFSPANVGGDDSLDSDADPVTGQTETIILYTNEINDTWDVGLYSATITCDTTIVAGDVTGLIGAIDSADNTPEADTICLEAGTYTPSFRGVSFQN